MTARRRVTIDDLRSFLTVDVETAGAALGLSRPSAYAAANRGEIPTLRIGGRLLVPVPRLLELVGYTPEQSDASPAATGPVPIDSTPDQGARRDHGAQQLAHRASAVTGM